MNIKTIEIAGFASALEALRLPFGKECRSDIVIRDVHHKKYDDAQPMYGGISYQSTMRISADDMKLLSSLVKCGDEHAKVLRGVCVWAEIDAPIYFYRELETYRMGRERLASNSTMHQQCKGLHGEELIKAKAEMPMGTMQKTVDMFSYQTLRRIYFQRRNHRLPEWRTFCDWIEGLPFAKELIVISTKTD